jgi:biopolymer transport protein ExbB/TolQ
MFHNKFIHIVVLTCSLFFLFNPGLAQEQQPAADSTAQQGKPNLIDPSSLTNITDLKSLWDMTKLGGGFRWIIIGLFVVGMMTVIYKVSELLLDAKHSHELEQVNLRKASLVDISAVIKNNKKSLLSHLFKYMIDLYQTRKSAEGFSDEIIDYIQIHQDRFQAFQTKMLFFSDTAGALGLLGTVWGMFLTFFGGDLEKHKILSGMGIALITTLMGLVVSIFLNLFATQTHSYFRKRIDKVTDLGNLFRLRLHQIEQTLDNSLPDYDTPMNHKIETPKYELSDAVFDEVDRKLRQAEPILDIINGSSKSFQPENNSYQLVSVSGNNQAVEVNTRLEKPLIVQTTKKNGNGISNKAIVFEVIAGNGKLSNGRKQEETATDLSGLAQAQLILGSTAGENRVRVKVKDSENTDIFFSAWGKPTSPDRMAYVSGNHQHSASGAELKDPFVVKIIDKFNNPVPNWPVTYKVNKGNGYFPEKKRVFDTETDENGIAEAYFTLGNEPGFNSVRATAKGIKKAKFEFEALGQG